MLRRTWARRGSRPVARQHPRYQWLYVYTFVRPDTGDTFWLLLPTVSTEAFSIALREFAEAVGVGPDHHVLLVLDRAGWHTTDKLDVPEGIHLEFLPPYSPELMPAERLWPVLREAVANRPVHNLDQLEARLTFRIKALRRNPAFIAGLTGYRWWMDALRPIV